MIHAKNLYFDEQKKYKQYTSNMKKKQTFNAICELDQYLSQYDEEPVLAFNNKANKTSASIQVDSSESDIFTARLSNGIATLTTPLVNNANANRNSSRNQNFNNSSSSSANRNRRQVFDQESICYNMLNRTEMSTFETNKSKIVVQSDVERLIAKLQNDKKIRKQKYK